MGDELLGLPPCVIVECSKCGNTENTGWISRDWGCKKCSPEDEEKAMEACANLDNRPS